MSEAVLEAKNVSIYYGDFQAVKSVDLAVPAARITAFIGPSGCGKSTFLRSVNRMNDFVGGSRVEGDLLFQGQDIYAEKVDPVELRRRVGMVFQKPNPFPKSIFENIAWAPRLHGYQGDLKDLVESSLQRAALWDEVKDKLDQSGLSLSGGQQQRLCIARAIALKPEVLLMDEPCSALDPGSTARVEELILELRQDITIVIVTHNMQQARRCSDETAFFYNGHLIESGPSEQLFESPAHPQTADYLKGSFG